VRGEEDVGLLGRRIIDKDVACQLLAWEWGRHPIPFTLLTHCQEDRGRQTVAAELSSTEGIWLV
jgi:hypothetical protein